MGSWFSKDSNEPKTDNKGVLNGNNININNIDENISDIEKLFYVVIVVLLIIFAYMVLKTYTKYVKTAHQNRTNLNTLVLKSQS